MDTNQFDFKMFLRVWGRLNIDSVICQNVNLIVGKISC